MSDFASIMGGNAPDGMVGQRTGLDDVGGDWDAFYSIQSASVFLDRFDSTGTSIVDAVGNANPVEIELGAGADTVTAGGGGDTVWAGAGKDVVDAGAGDDTISGGTGDDLIEGRDGKDSLSGGFGDDTILAGGGDDYAVGGNGADALQGGGGNDHLFGSSGNDSLFGQEGADSLVGGSGADLLMGGAGDDTLLGGSGGDVFAFDNGFGRDVISDFGPGDQINLAADLNGSGITDARQLVDRGLVTGGTSPSGTPFTLITVGGDTIRLDNVDHLQFSDQISTLVKVG